jgi:hypothetical protein
MKYLRKISNGILLIIIGLFHTKLALTNEGFGVKFAEFSNSCFYKIHNGLDELPFTPGKMSVNSLESFSAFWFFYFGIMLIPIGLLVHSIEKSGRVLPAAFTVSYLIIVLIGAYMIPNSGMTIIMLPHALYMLISNIMKSKKLESVSQDTTKQ